MRAAIVALAAGFLAGAPPADYLDARTMTRSVCLAEAMGISAMVLDMAGDVLRQTCKPAKKTSKKSSKKASKKVRYPSNLECTLKSVLDPVLACL